MATEADTRRALQIILGFEESYLAMNSINSNLYDKSEPAHVQTAAAKESDEILYTSQTFDSLQAALSLRLKGALQAPTGPSLLLSDPAIPQSTYVSSSKRTTGQRSFTNNVTPNGQPVMDSSQQSVKRSQKLGLPTDPAQRKKIPLWSGLVAYFPDALAAVAAVSYQGSKQHHPDKPLHWDRSKSTDQHDTLLRHLFESGTVDSDGQRHSAKVAWRALALLQLEIEASK